MTTNFGTKIAINWLCVNDTARQLIMEAGLSNANTLHLRDVAMATIFAFYIWVHTGDTWRTRLNYPCAPAMRPYVKLL